jgi:hypothetical protein
VLLKDVDLVRWKQDLIEDRNRLATLLCAPAEQVDARATPSSRPARDDRAQKCRNPINPGNRKVIVFTAFADTARTSTTSLPPWAKATSASIHALVTGTGATRPRCQPAQGPGLDPHHVLAALQGAARGLRAEGELDLLIATDCISEGQNLQDCDWLINYDIHWNPVRIIQRFGRIDRIGSPNERIQLVNFWPNMELEEYINLEQRVSGAWCCSTSPPPARRT